jgi:hypothetical protein
MAKHFHPISITTNYRSFFASTEFSNCDCIGQRTKFLSFFFSTLGSCLFALKYANFTFSPLSSEGFAKKILAMECASGLLHEHKTFGVRFLRLLVRGTREEGIRNHKLAEFFVLFCSAPGSRGRQTKKIEIIL